MTSIVALIVPLVMETPPSRISILKSMHHTHMYRALRSTSFNLSLFLLPHNVAAPDQVGTNCAISSALIA